MYLLYNKHNNNNNNDKLSDRSFNGMDRYGTAYLNANRRSTPSKQTEKPRSPPQCRAVSPERNSSNCEVNEASSHPQSSQEPVRNQGPDHKYTIPRIPQRAIQPASTSRHALLQLIPGTAAMATKVKTTAHIRAMIRTRSVSHAKYNNSKSSVKAYFGVFPPSVELAVVCAVSGPVARVVEPLYV